MPSEEHAYWMAVFSKTDGTMDFRDRERWFASAERRLTQIKIDAGLLPTLPAPESSAHETDQIGGS
jgi:hypothetical protein